LGKRREEGKDNYQGGNFSVGYENSCFGKGRKRSGRARMCKRDLEEASISLTPGKKERDIERYRLFRTKRARPMGRGIHQDDIKDKGIIG